MKLFTFLFSMISIACTLLIVIAASWFAGYAVMYGCAYLTACGILHPGITQCSVAAIIFLVILTLAVKAAKI